MTDLKITILRDPKSNVEQLAGSVLWVWAVAGIIGIGILVAPMLGYEPSRDATDSVTARSGMSLRFDYGTGCQYLESSKGYLTPRVGADGKQVCEVSK